MVTFFFFFFLALELLKVALLMVLHFSERLHFKACVHGVFLLSFEFSGVGRVGGTSAESLTGLLAHLRVLAVVLGGRMESKCRWRLL